MALCGVGTWVVAQNVLAGVLPERNPTGSNEPATSGEIMPAEAGLDQLLGYLVLPCREEMPQMQKLYEEYASRDLAIIGVNVQETPEQVQEYTTEGGYNETS